MLKIAYMNIKKEGSRGKEMITKIKEFIKKHNSLKKVVKNSGWLVFQNIFTMLLGAFVTGIIARYFGTEKYGIFNYVLSITGLFSGIAAIRNISYCYKRPNTAPRK